MRNTVKLCRICEASVMLWMCRKKSRCSGDTQNRDLKILSLFPSLCVNYINISLSVCLPASVCNPIPPLMTPAQFTGGPLARPTASQTTPTQVLPQFRAPPPSKFSEEGFVWTEPATVEVWRPMLQKHQSEKVIQRLPDHRYTNTSAHPVTLVVFL